VLEYGELRTVYVQGILVKEKHKLLYKDKKRRILEDVLLCKMRRSLPFSYQTLSVCELPLAKN